MKKIGKLFLALGMIAFFAGCKASTEELTLTKIEITNPADKVEYIVGEYLDTTGLEITATYSDESTQVVTGWTTSGYDKTKTGEQTVTVSYTEEEVTSQTSYTVKSIELTKIEITTQPAKKEYFVGATKLDLAGLKVTATYSDGTTKDVTADVTISGFNASAATESQTITVTYGGKTATFTVKINPVLLTGIAVTTQPTKKEYFVGAQELNLAGLKVTATYNDGTTKDVTADVTTSGFNSSAAVDNQTITVTYGGKTATFAVKIKPILTGIAITTLPTKEEYHISDEIDLTGMVVTASYNDGSTKTLASNEYTVTGFDLIAYVDEQEITVTYNEKTAILKIKVAFDWYETPLTLPASTNGTYGTEGTYVLFGVWPQDVVPVADVETLGLETSTDKVTRGYMDFVKGTDGNYYVKCKEIASANDYKYKKDKSHVGGTGSRWFKVMPIKWRVVDTEYDVDGSSGSETAKLLVAENILTANVPYYETQINHRNGTFPNNYMHSQIRAYLNGISYNAADSENNNKWYDNANSKGKGFLQTAFGETAKAAIKDTVVDNSADSTTNFDTQNGKLDKATDFACDPTTDKIFLLSEYEVTKYSKEAFDSNEQGNSRIRETTDFAKANSAYHYSTEGYGGYWWLRSPNFHIAGNYFAHVVYYGGGAYDSYPVSIPYYGVVPALSISF